MRSKTGRSLKKFLSFLLTVSMVVGMLPTFAAATVTSGELESGDLKYAKAEFTAAKTIAPIQVGTTTDVPVTAHWYHASGTHVAILDNTQVLDIDGATVNFDVTVVFGAVTDHSNPAGVTWSGDDAYWTHSVNRGPGKHNIPVSLKNGSSSADSGTVTITIPASGIKVTYNNPKGAAVTDAKEYTTGDSITLLAPDAREGFEFVGWKDAGGTVYPVNSTITAEYSHIDLTAVWKHDFTISDDAEDLYEATDLLEGEFNLAVTSNSAPDEVKAAAVAAVPEKSLLAYFTADISYNGTPLTNVTLSKKIPVTVSGLALPVGAAAKVYHWNGSALEKVTDVTVGTGGTINFETNKFSPFVVLVDPVTATFRDKGGYKISSETVERGTTIELPAPPAADSGTTFEGWYVDKDADKKYSAGDEKISGTTYTILADTTIVARYVEGSSVGTKWTVTFYNDYTIDAPLAASNVIVVKSVADGSYLEAPTVTKDGKVFAGWKKWVDDTGADGKVQTGELSDFTLGTPVSGPLVLVAAWEDAPANSFDVTFNMNDGTTAVYEKQKVAKNDYAKRPAVPERTGYVFGGWYTWVDSNGNTVVEDTELTVFDFNTAITAKTDLYAKWTVAPVYYDVVFMTNTDAAVGNMPADGKVEENQSYTIPVQAPVRTDYEFKGWDTNKDATTATYAWDGSAFAPDAIPNVAGNVTLYAVWAPVQVNVKYLAASTTAIAGIKTFTVTNGATTLTEGGSGNSVAKNSTVTIEVKLAEGYDPATLTVLAGDKPLYGLLSGTDTYYFEFTAEKDTEIKIANTLAKKQFTITLPQGDGYTTEFAECDPSDADGKTSHTFKYGEKFKVKLTVQPDIQATLKIDGTTAAEITAGATAQNKTSSEVVVKKEHNVSVAIEKKIIRTVTYSLEPHSGLYTTQLVENNTAATKPADPKIRGYNFDGKWYTKPDYSVEWNFDDAVTADMILYGKLTAKTNTISYAENKPTGVTAAVGNMPAGTTKTYGESVQLDAKKPTLEGYNFMGWATSATGPVAYQPGETFITELDANITLYAVWQIKTYTVTMPAGTGYSVTPSGVNTVEWMSDFTFTLNVDRQYAATAPTITYQLDGDSNVYTIDATAQKADNAATSASYTIADITKNVTVSISVTQNAVHTVEFYVSKNGTAETDPFLTQSVEHGYYATMPAAPDVEGFVFKNVFYTTAGGTTKFPFDTIVTGDMDAYAYYAAITPQVVLPADGTGWTITFDGVDNILGSQTGDYAYGADAEFVITVQPGYDMTNIKVSVNDNLWAYTNKTVAPDGTVTLEYIIHNLTEEVYNVRVTDIERKTVTVTYMPNAKDDVSGWTGGQEQINYYIDAADDGRITSKVPSRTGYTFLGWSLDADRDPDQFNTGTNADRDFVADEVAGFTTDTTLYAIWKAKATTILLTIEGDYYNGNALIDQYEGNEVTLVAKITTPDNGKVQGDVTFWRETVRGTKQKLGTSSVVNNEAILENVKVGNFENETAANKFYAVDYLETYWVEFTPTTDEGYAANTDDELEVLRVWSKAIAWNEDNKLSITGTLVDGKMVAGNTYTLTIPAVKAYNAPATDVPKAGTDYEVIWEVKNDQNGWDTVAVSQTDSYVITEYKAGQVFRARVEAKGSIFDKEIEYVDDAATTLTVKLDTAVGKVDFNLYDDFLYTKETEKTVVQPTTTDLEITGADNEGTVTIAGTSVTTGLAQFEGQKVTLKATVKETSTGTPAVTTGYVNFYRYGTTEPLNTTPVAVGANGVATFEVTISTYNTGAAVTANVDRFYAVYLVNDTYDTSASVTKSGTAYSQPGDEDSVWIKSTAIQTPVIDAKRGTTDEGSTSYTADLTGLLAGVEHTFTLRTGNAAADWSVVALDGRTVASTDYTIQWLVTTGTNEEKAANNETAATFVVNESKSGDKYRVKLVPTADGDMKTGATSKYVVINSLQNVTVKVTASDEIKSTPETDVYQLNDITLTAEVQGKDSQIMPPTGNVTFYYSVNGTNWVEIGTAALKQDDVSRTMKATFVTAKLPVDVTNGYKQEEVTITAVYAGDETFQKSGEFNTTTKEIVDTVNGDVTDATVTVYSSVVLVHAAEENTAVTSLTNGGIHISANGSLVANETDVALTLQQVYTLDYNIDLSKLVYGTDYTVEWQILDNPSLYNDGNGYYGNTEKWNDIGATGSSYTIGTVPQDAAYRAKITVTNTAPVQGSAQGVLQGAANATTNGRQVYYSNVLVVGAGQATVTTNITTSANKNFNEEGIVEGETVTIHALVAGASGVTPISKLTATILSQGATDPAQAVFTAGFGEGEKVTTVNGYNAFTWNTTGVTPGYYTLTVEATSNNGYAPQTITRTLIVRDNDYTLTVTDNSKVYNGKAQGIDWSLDGVDIENTLAQNSVVVYYYQNGKMVEPTQAGEYTYELYLPASAYWTELTHVTGEFTITPRPVNVVDLVAQAKVYDGTTNANIQEIILEDAVTNQTTGLPLPTDNTGIINGDSVYAVGTGYTAAVTAGPTTLGVKDVTLKGDDAANYDLVSYAYTEAFNIQRSQVKGDIANSTFQYTGSNITVPADDIYLIDQAGNVITPANYTVTYYYHNGDGVEQVDAMNKLGKYTVIARPEQDNYKGGASQIVYVVSDNANDAAPTAPTSALIDITNTVELYGNTNGVVATATKGTAAVQYYVNGAWTDNRPTDAGRYLVKASVTNDTVTDTAYGIYTIVKARPEFVPTTDAAEETYNSAPYSGTVDAGFVTGKSDNTAETYITYTGGTIQGIAYEAPTEVGKYIATVHVGETANYTAHEEQVAFEIKPKALTITADNLARWQYGSYPDMVATFEGLATGGVAADTSLRDVQIQPEFIFNDLNGDGQPEYTNSALDQVGKDYPITVRNALARNYTVTYVAGSYAVNELDPKADLAIHGMIDNGLTPTQNIAYYGDQIQLYAYGNYKSNGDGTGVYNPSSLLEWSLSAGAPATIDQDGLLTITGVGTFNVTLTRGSGDAKISTSIEIKAKKQEVKIEVKDRDAVYTGSNYTYSITNSNVNAFDAMGKPVVAVNSSKPTSIELVTGSSNVRLNVGSQIVTVHLTDSVTNYVSEAYGGLFTINDKEVTVAPVEQTKVYGTKEAYEATDTTTGKAYSETGVVGGKAALTTNGSNKLGVVASVSDLYENIDVSSTGYEILVAGPENMNYNVKYTTAAASATAKVTAKSLTVSTGTLDTNVGMTSGSLNPVGKFPVNGAEVNASATLGASNVRMYGEPNWVMDFDVWTDPNALISGDSLADLADLAGNLVKFNYNIGDDANITYPTRNDASPVAVEGRGAYNVDTDASMIAFGNYNESYNKGTQNIYQRPVKLELSNGTDTLDVLFSDVDSLSEAERTAYLRDLIVANLNVLKYTEAGQEVGGLATLLKHTANDLDYELTYTYDASGFDVTIKAINNYWSENYTIHVNVVKEKYRVVYNSFTATSATVTLYHVNLDTGAETAEFLPSGNLMCKIFIRTADDSYLGETPVVNVAMQETSTTGVYTVTYPRLVGSYHMFAIAEGGVGYTIVNGIE